MFLRKSRIEPLPVTMSAVRMGDRVLQAGIDDPEVASALAAKVGLSGHAAIAVRDEVDAARARSAASRSGTLVDVEVAPPTALPFDTKAFDLVIVHSHSGLLARLEQLERLSVMHEWHRVLRVGGRVLVIEPGAITGMKSLLRGAQVKDAYETAGGAVAALEAAGFRAVRVVGEREGFKFTEAVKA